MDVLNEYFEVVSDDVYYTFKGLVCCNLAGGVKSRLYGKTINLSKLHGVMLDDIIEKIPTGEFCKDEYLDTRGKLNLIDSLNKYTTDRYGISLDWVDKTVNDRSGRLDIDGLYNIMIQRAGGVDCIDWLGIYTYSGNFVTYNSDILVSIAKSIICNDIYSYFVDRYKLRVSGMDLSCKGNSRVVLEWGVNGKLIDRINRLTRSKKDWWRRMTTHSKKRENIHDYDKLLNGRSEDVVLPDYCPVFGNMRLNYTNIDFEGNMNLKNCNANVGDMWSSASIDRRDSNKGYSYDNIRIISHFANSAKGCATDDQIIRLGEYLKNDR